MALERFKLDSSTRNMRSHQDKLQRLRVVGAKLSSLFHEFAAQRGFAESNEEPTLSET